MSPELNQARLVRVEFETELPQALPQVSEEPFCFVPALNSEVARKLHITAPTVGKWRERFRQSGLDGLLDEPRVGAPRKITDSQLKKR